MLPCYTSIYQFNLLIAIVLIKQIYNRTFICNKFQERLMMSCVKCSLYCYCFREQRQTNSRKLLILKVYLLYPLYTKVLTLKPITRIISNEKLAREKKTIDIDRERVIIYYSTNSLFPFSFITLIL